MSLVSSQFQNRDTIVFKQDEPRRIVAINCWPASCFLGGMKVAAKENRKSLDYFTSTIIPSQALQAVAVLTIKHAVLFVGFGVGMMALVRLLLAD